MSLAADPNTQARKIPGWEESLQELVSTDREYITAVASDSSASAFDRMKAALLKIHGILSTVIQPLIVPEEIGRQILSLTEGWENFWVDYDLLSAVQASTALSGCNVMSLDALGKDVIDIMSESFSMDDVPENLRVVVSARRRLLKAVSNDQARLVLICARITAVDILLRQPRKSSLFLSSYFQSFPSFICQVASVSNLMAARAVSDSTPVVATSIESMIAYSGMSLLSTVITETNHITQALSVLSANNPHAGILANLMNLTLSQSALQNGLETYQLSKAAIYVLMSSIQNARHPSTVANATMTRKILEVLVDPLSHPEVTHACCVCLEVALEYCHNSFTILFRDLDALNKLIDRGNFLVDIISNPNRPSNYPLTSSQKALNSVFGLLRFSFQSQEIHVGINLHEKLTIPNSPLLRLLITVLSSPLATIGKSPFNGCLTLVGNVMADDPLIISTLVDVGLIEALINTALVFNEKRVGDVLSSMFVAVGAVLLHESGAKKLRELGDPVRRLLQAIASDEFENSMDKKDTAPDEMMRIPDDVGLIAGQTCDDIIRNRPDNKTELIENVIHGLDRLLAVGGQFEHIPMDRRIIPGLRILFGGLLSTSDQVELFIQKGGVSVLSKIFIHPELRNGALLENVPGTTKSHPVISVFKQIGQRAGRPNIHLWQQPLAEIVRDFSFIDEERVFSFISTICSVLNVTSPSGIATTLDHPSGAYVFLASSIGDKIPQLFRFFLTRRDHTPEWMSQGWLSVKNYIATLARVSHSLFHAPPSKVGFLSKGALSPGLLALNTILVRAVNSLSVIVNPTSSEEITEYADLLNRVLVEDRNHAIRPIAVLELYRSGSLLRMLEVFNEFVIAHEDASSLSGFETFLIMFERLTSFKRIMNSPMTKAALDTTLIPEWTPSDLNVSVTTKIGQLTIDRLSHFLSLKSVSSTSATAIAKILSHTVMMAEHIGPEVAPASSGPVTRSKRSKSPAKKRPRTSKAKAGKDTVSVESLISLKEASDDVIEALFVNRSEFAIFVPEQDARQLAVSTIESFLQSCVSLGDLGGCESSMVELIQRHVDSETVSIVPASKAEKFGTNAAMYVMSSCDEYGPRNRSSTASAILTSMLTRMDLSVPAGMGLSVIPNENMVGSAEAAAAATRALTVFSKIAGSVLFEGGLPVEEQQSLTATIMNQLGNIADNEHAKTLAQACLANISTLVRRGENRAAVIEKLDLLIDLPAYVRTTDTAPIVTEILLSVVGSELISAVKIHDELDIVLNLEMSVESAMQGPFFIDKSVREPELLRNIVTTLCKRQQLGSVDSSEEDEFHGAYLTRDPEASLDFSQFTATPDLAETILLKLTKKLLECIPMVNKKNCSGLSDMLPPSDEEYRGAFTVESLLIATTVILGEISTIQRYDSRYDSVHKKFLNELVGPVGRCLITELAQIHDSTGVAAALSVDPNVFKLVRVWYNSINRSSPWLTGDVLGMIQRELEQTAGKLSEDQQILQAYAYGGLVCMLSDSSGVLIEKIEGLLPLLSDMLKRTSEITTLCRFDSHLSLEALFASLYALISRVREAAEVSSTAISEESGEQSSDEGEEGDAEMSEDSGDEEGDDDESMDDANMPEAFEIEIDEDDDDNGQGEDEEEEDMDAPTVDEIDDEENVFSDNQQEEDDESSSNDTEASEEDYDEEEYGAGWSELEDYDVEWEEDDEEEDEDEEGDEGIIEGDQFIGVHEDDLGIEIADYMMEPIGSPQMRPAASPSLGPEASPTSRTPPSGPGGFNKATLEKAKQVLRTLFTEEITAAIEEEEEDRSNEEGEMMSSEEEDRAAIETPLSSTGRSELLDMTEEEQLAALQGLSAEERASIQQALGMDEEDLSLGSDLDYDNEDEFDEYVLPPNVRITHGPVPEMHMTLEVPRNMPADRQASMINQAISELTGARPEDIVGSMVPPVMMQSTVPKKVNAPKSEFPMTDPIPKPDQSEKLCSDSPSKKSSKITCAESILSSMESVGSVTSRALMLRNQVPLKPALDRVLIQLCLEPRSRRIVLNNLFASLIKFVYPAGSPWTLNTAGEDSAMPPIMGVFDGGLHPLLPRSSRSMDVNAPGQCRSVGSGRLINMLKFIVEHVPRARLWFTELIVTELRSAITEQSLFEGRKTPEKPKRRNSASNATTPQAGFHYASSDGEGPLVRAVSSQSSVLASYRKVNPLTVCIKTLSSALMWGSPSHSLILMSLVLEILAPFPDFASDSSDCDSAIRQAVPEDAIQLLCELLVENKSRLRHMPEFDKAVGKATQVMVSLCKDVKVREIVRQRLVATGSRLVSDMLARLNDKESSFSAVPLVRLFRTAKEAFGTKRVAVSESESFLDFAPCISNIDSLWKAIDTRLAAHNNLLLSAPSVAQQALQKRRRGESSGNEMVGADEDSLEATAGTTNKIAALETIAKLIPLVELFLSAHDVSAVWKKSEHERNRPGRWSSEPPSDKENNVSRKAIDFIERHRRPINSMVKSRPSILNKAFAPLVAICPHLLDFDNKRSFFRTKLRQVDSDTKHPPPQLKLNVRRDDVFRDSYAKLQVRSKEEWRGRLNITFQGEEGVDAGGLVREWFSILAREIFNPNYALFTPASGRPSTFLINPASSVNPDHIHYFKFCGRFIGKAVYDNQRIDAYFVRSFYKHMLGQEVTWRDMEATDPDYFKNLNWILENDMTEVDYYYFTVEENEFGKLKVVELIPDGENIRVTEANKDEYVRLVCEHKLTKGIQEQLKAFLQGFHELIPERIVGSLFDDKELEMLISGLPTIDLEDLKRNTDYVHYTSESDQIKWFWSALEKFTEDELAWFMQFVTGSTQVPLEGFKGLAGMHGPQRFSIHRIRAEDRLPTAHTCFNQLDLPDYPDYETLASKLKQAVRDGHSGFGFI